MRYRWAVLAAGAAASGATAAFFLGLPVLVPTLRAEYSLSLAEIGVVLASGWVGTTLALLPWGLAADRFGERVVMSMGVGGCAAFLACAAFAPGYPQLVGLLALAGGAGAAVNSASGRAVMRWFDAGERGLALGIRQSAIPVGGFVGALALPAIAGAGGSEAAFLFLAGVCAMAAVVGALVLRDRNGEDELQAASVLGTLAESRLWRLSLGSGLYLYAQLAILGFAVLFLHDEHGLSQGRAALVIAAAQAVAIILRVVVGRWSDVVGSRIRPFTRIGVATGIALLAVALLVDGPLWVLVIALAVGGGLSMAWNGLSFTVAAELAGAERSGAAIGFQQTVLGGFGVVAPLLFAALVSGTSWRVAFGLAALAPVAGLGVLRPLRGH